MSMTSNIGVPIINVNRHSYSQALENIGMSIGERIRKTREEIDKTQEWLCEKVGFKQPTLSQLENGDSAGSKYLPAIAAALGVNAYWLQTGRGSKHPIQSISPKELQLVIAYREATDEGKTFIEMACSSAPKTVRPE